MLLLLLTTGARCSTLSGTGISATASKLLPGKSISRRQLDFQFNNFIPLLIRAITLRHRKELAQTATAIQPLRRRRLIN